MRNTEGYGDPNWKHIPPRDRIMRHALKRARSRYDVEFKVATYEQLCADMRAGKLNLAGRDDAGNPFYEVEIGGRKVYAVRSEFEPDLIVTFVNTVEHPNRKPRPAKETALGSALKRAGLAPTPS